MDLATLAVWFLITSNVGSALGSCVTTEPVVLASDRIARTSRYEPLPPLLPDEMSECEEYSREMQKHIDYLENTRNACIERDGMRIIQGAGQSIGPCCLEWTDSNNPELACRAKVSPVCNNTREAVYCAYLKRRVNLKDCQEAVRRKAR